MGYITRGREREGEREREKVLESEKETGREGKKIENHTKTEGERGIERNR